MFNSLGHATHDIIWKGRLMKWVVESSPAAVTRQSGKTATLRWRLVSRQIVLFSTTACSSINQR
ncbi:unnamed protein product [Spirodela intermedia]|uniref:Uncharacterized protein n=1 Tax=Spirodela intermedia TaxID=51605 RepID=A0A7I8KWV0_SPIIN|nr:unnamed protein product [Spirodela intermedia]